MSKRRLKKLPAAFYQLPAGREPVREWLKKLDPLDQKSIGDDIATAEFGWPIGMPLCRSLTSRSGLWEIRTDLTSGRIARVYQKDAGNTETSFRFSREKKEGAIMQRRQTKKSKGKIGSSFSSYLEEKGTLTETTNRAIKRVIAYELERAMNERSISKSAMAERMETSRSQVNRLLDPDNDAVSIRVLATAAKALGRELVIGLK